MLTTLPCRCFSSAIQFRKYHCKIHIPQQDKPHWQSIPELRHNYATVESGWIYYEKKLQSPLRVRAAGKVKFASTLYQCWFEDGYSIIASVTLSIARVQFRLREQSIISPRAKKVRAGAWISDIVKRTFHSSPSMGLRAMMLLSLLDWPIGNTGEIDESYEFYKALSTFVQQLNPSSVRRSKKHVFAVGGRERRWGRGSFRSSLGSSSSSRHVTFAGNEATRQQMASRRVAV